MNLMNISMSNIRSFVEYLASLHICIKTDVLGKLVKRAWHYTTKNQPPQRNSEIKGRSFNEGIWELTERSMQAFLREDYLVYSPWVQF